MSSIGEKIRISAKKLTALYFIYGVSDIDQESANTCDRCPLSEVSVKPLFCSHSWFRFSFGFERKCVFLSFFLSFSVLFDSIFGPLLYLILEKETLSFSLLSLSLSVSECTYSTPFVALMLLIQSLTPAITFCNVCLIQLQYCQFQIVLHLICENWLRSKTKLTALFGCNSGKEEGFTRNGKWIVSTR